MNLTKAQLEWIREQCFGPALTYLGHARMGGLFPAEKKKMEEIILPAMDGLEQLIKEAPDA